MIVMTKTRAYARIGLILTVFAAIAACALLPSAPTPTSLPSSTPEATLTPIALPSSPTSTAQPVDAQADTGWQAEYFNNDAWQAPVTLSRVDPDPLFDWKDGSPAPEIPTDNFSVRWTRCLKLEERYYIFTVQADDYVRVLVDDFQVVAVPIAATIERPFAVSAGEHCIKIEYKELGGVASINFSFQPGEPITTADASTAWKGEYFNNQDFLEPVIYTRNDPAPIFDWKEGNPAPGISVDNFSVRWTRCLDLEGREYIFAAHADDYVRVLIDDVQVVEASLYVNIETPIAVTAGRHCIKVEYREGGGRANVYFSFQ